MDQPPPTGPIRILLADDHTLILDGISSILAAAETNKIVAACANGAEAKDYISNNSGNVDLVITDISMPITTGVELCRWIKQEHSSIKVLILSMYSSPAIIKECLAAEADGYLLKDASREDILLAVSRVADGGTFFSQQILPIIANQLKKEGPVEQDTYTLSKREKEVLQLIANEHTSEEIANILFISKKTVDNHRQNMLEKSGCKTTIGLLKYAMQQQIL